MGGEPMKKFLKRYAAFLITALLFALFIVFFPVYRAKAGSSLIFQLKTMLLVIPPIFILLGLLDAWVPREKMMKYMGPDSGIRGGALAFLLGSFAAGPLYGAFPVSAVLMKKGASFMNVLIFLGAWSTTKIPMILFEIHSLGSRFALSMLAIDIVGVVILALAIKALVPERERAKVYAEAEKLG
jgi:uncharacterized membrane protein YraQ (UPF0718 family)